ncbi:hypothetical protein J2W79_000103 [Methylorubrum extorquens]|nr:hypothetical protein [Methylorubrum extorquens]MCP1535046.1 hypothetical protein [Methylorubrum extorquens]
MQRNDPARVERIEGDGEAVEIRFQRPRRLVGPLACEGSGHLRLDPAAILGIDLVGVQVLVQDRLERRDFGLEAAAGQDLDPLGGVGPVDRLQGRVGRGLALRLHPPALEESAEDLQHHADLA